jgi:hypothetical protein
MDDFLLRLGFYEDDEDDEDQMELAGALISTIHSERNTILLRLRLRGTGLGGNMIGMGR